MYIYIYIFLFLLSFSFYCTILLGCARTEMQLLDREDLWKEIIDRRIYPVEGKEGTLWRLLFILKLRRSIKHDRKEKLKL